MANSVDTDHLIYTIFLTYSSILDKYGSLCLKDQMGPTYNMQFL